MDGLAFELEVARPGASSRRRTSTACLAARGPGPLARAGHTPTCATYPSIEAAAQRLDQLRSDAVVDQVNADLALGRHESLAPALQNLVTDNPFDERLWAALALAYYRRASSPRR